MAWSNLSVRIISFSLVGVGAGLLVLNLLLGGRLNISLPLVFLALGGGFFILVLNLRPRWAWTASLYFPAMFLSTMGIIFLLTVLTQDWNAWAYAWLLLLASGGAALLLANRDLFHLPVLEPLGWIIALGGLALFALFGALVGGLFIQVAAPILLVSAGLSLRWLPLDAILPPAILERLAIQPRTTPGENGTPPMLQKPGAASGSLPELVEGLSQRELEVLRLIDAGLSNQEIAEELSVAPSTVKTHINNIYGKLNVQSRVQAVQRARALHLLEG